MQANKRPASKPEGRIDRHAQDLIKAAQQSVNRWVILLTVLAVLATVGFLWYRLYQLQIVNHVASAEKASAQYYTKDILPPRRGNIFDRNGKKMAGSSFTYTVGITPRYLYSQLSKGPDTKEIVKFLCDKLSIETEALQTILKNQANATYVQLAKLVAPGIGKEIDDYLSKYLIGGVRLDIDPIRVYYNGKLASHVLGFCSKPEGNLQGVMGVEAYYNRALTGEPGYSYAASDNFTRYPLPFAKVLDKPAVDGQNLYLTIDTNIQEIVQRHLSQAVKIYQPRLYGMALAMNPQNGEILAMASYPYFDTADPYAPPDIVNPIRWRNLSNEEQVAFTQEFVWRNKALSDSYEAGSTFKAITAAIGIEENVTTEKTSYNDSTVHVADYDIGCAAGGHGWETMEEGFWRSCNPVFVQIAQAVGVPKFYDYIRSFGFREQTGIDLAGEGECIFHEHPQEIDMATLAFGEQSPVTPVHLMTAYAALVNGGYLVTPHVLKEMRNPATGAIMVNDPPIRRQVISSQTSARIRKLMEGMVEYSSPYTFSGGFRVGGKTSTSVDEQTDEYTISFVEAGPIDRPKLLFMMVLQRPYEQGANGGDAQIVTMNCASEILEYMYVDRDYTTKDKGYLQTLFTMPDIRGMTVYDAWETVKYHKLVLRLQGPSMTGKTVIKDQFPAPGTPLHIGSYCYAYDREPAPKPLKPVPNFSGQNIGECIAAANQAGFFVQFVGPLLGEAVGQAQTQMPFDYSPAYWSRDLILGTNGDVYERKDPRVNPETGEVLPDPGEENPQEPAVPGEEAGVFGEEEPGQQTTEETAPTMGMSPGEKVPTLPFGSVIRIQMEDTKEVP